MEEEEGFQESLWSIGTTIHESAPRPAPAPAQRAGRGQQDGTTTTSGGGEKKPEPALVGATARPRAEIGGSFGGVGGYAAPQPRYAPQSPEPGGNGPQYPPRYPNADPWAQQQQPPRQPPAGPTWPQPQSPGWDNSPTQAYPPAAGGAPYAPQQGGSPYAQGGAPYAPGGGQHPGRPGYPAGPSTPGTPGRRVYQRPEPPRSPRPDAGWGDQQGSGWGNDDDWPSGR